jgi:protein O-GlcNAc transferase
VKVISFTLFGEDPLYQVGAVENARICADLYPGWLLRFYVGDSIPATVCEDIAQHGNADLVAMRGHHEDWWATFWRLRALRDDYLDAVMFRDTDSRPDERERAAVDEWLHAGAEFHFMRDHPEHGMPILAGMWGCTRAGARRIRERLPYEPGPVEQYLADQFWLRDHVYPVAVDHAVIHASPASPRMDDDVRGDLRDWPTPREPGRFVGQGYCADGLLRIPADAARV